MDYETYKDIQEQEVIIPKDSKKPEAPISVDFEKMRKMDKQRDRDNNPERKN